MTPCVSPETLEQLLAGTLAEPEAGRAREHLTHCPACQQILDRLSDYPLVSAWRAGSDPTEPRDSLELPSLLARLRDTPLPESLREETGGTLGTAFFSFLGPPHQPGDLGSLGPYRVLAELGRGGMGVVFRAIDPALNREVALKVLWPERADARARARFVREARAAAALVHDHVAPVYSVTDPPDGPPYLTMQLVPGPSLARRIRDRFLVGPDEAARIALQVADGLTAAHRAGLVHRDVKPGNILLDPIQGRAKLVDFGLVRVLEGQGTTTVEGSVRGTPEYMSPEQFRDPDRVDGRADVYGLGVTLYEMLTGETPFRGLPHLVLQKVLDEEPTPPRRLNDRVPKALEAVCLKAMAKEPARRYPTAQEFAEDLRRFLAGEPVRARPETALGRGWRWCRRNPRVALLSGTVLLLLVCLAAGSTVAAVWLDQARRETDTEKRAAEAASRASDHNADLARQAQRESAANARAAGAHFNVALGSLNTLIVKVQEQLAGQPGSLKLKKQLLDTAVQGLKQITASAAKAPLVDQQMVLAHLKLGDLFFLLGDTGQSRRQFEQARDLADKLARANPADANARRSLANALDQLGKLALYGDQPKTAAGYFRKARDLRADLLTADPHNPEDRRSLSVSHNKLGDVYAAEFDATAALAAYQRGLTELQALPEDRKQTSRYLEDLRFTFGRLGNASLALAEYAAARGYYQDSLKYAEELARREPGKRDLVGFGHDRLGSLLMGQGEYAAAAEQYLRALATRQQVAAADPDNAEAVRNVCVSFNQVGDARACAGRLDEARAAYREAVTRCEALAERDVESWQKQVDVGICYTKCAVLEECAGRFAEAADWLDKWIAGNLAMEKSGRWPGRGLAAYRQPMEQNRDAYRAAAKLGVEDLGAILAQKPAIAGALLGYRGRAFAQRGRHADAADAAGRLRKLLPTDAEALSYAARTYALCAGAPGCPEELCKQYADRALETLRTFLKRYPHLAYTVAGQPDFDSLRPLPAYQQLLRDLFRKTAAKGR